MKKMARTKKTKTYETYEWRQNGFLIRGEFEDGKFQNLIIGKEDGQSFNHLFTFGKEDQNFMTFVKETITDLGTLLK
jgi:hypothetical protein